MDNFNGSDIMDLMDFIKSPAFRRFLERRKKHFQEEVNKSVRAGDIKEAYANECLMRDQDRVIEIMNKEIEENKKGGE